MKMKNIGSGTVTQPKNEQKVSKKLSIFVNVYKRKQFSTVFVFLWNILEGSMSSKCQIGMMKIFLKRDPKRSIFSNKIGREGRKQVCFVHVFAEIYAQNRFPFAIFSIFNPQQMYRFLKRT